MRTFKADLVLLMFIKITCHVYIGKKEKLTFSTIKIKISRGNPPLLKLDEGLDSLERLHTTEKHTQICDSYYLKSHSSLKLVLRV